MAQVAQDVTANIDRLLDYLYDRWGDIAVAADEWETWDRVERADYLVDWPVVESYMEVMQSYVAQGVLTPVQHKRYQRLRHLVADHDPLLQHLKGEV